MSSGLWVQNLPDHLGVPLAALLSYPCHAVRLIGYAVIVSLPCSALTLFSVRSCPNRLHAPLDLVLDKWYGRWMDGEISGFWESWPSIWLVASALTEGH